MAPARDSCAEAILKVTYLRRPSGQAASRYPPPRGHACPRPISAVGVRNKMATNRFAAFNAPKEGLPSSWSATSLMSATVMLTRETTKVRNCSTSPGHPDGGSSGTLTDMAKDLSMRAPNRSGLQISVEVRDGDGALFQARFLSRGVLSMMAGPPSAADDHAELLTGLICPSLASENTRQARHRSPTPVRIGGRPSRSTTAARRIL